MLRTFVATIAAAFAVIGVGLICFGIYAPGWQLVFMSLIVLLATLFERWRYRRIEATPAGDWQQTGEEFVDPSSGKPVRVYFNPRTGERRYVAAPPGEANRDQSAP